MTIQTLNRECRACAYRQSLGRHKQGVRCLPPWSWGRCVSCFSTNSRLVQCCHVQCSKQEDAKDRNLLSFADLQILDIWVGHYDDEDIQDRVGDRIRKTQREQVKTARIRTSKSLDLRVCAAPEYHKQKIYDRPETDHNHHSIVELAECVVDREDSSEEK